MIEYGENLSNICHSTMPLSVSGRACNISSPPYSNYSKIYEKTKRYWLFLYIIMEREIIITN